MSGKRSSSSWPPPAGSRGLAGLAQSLRAVWPLALLRFLGYLAAVLLLWVVVAPVYARGLALIGRMLIPVLEAAPDTQYVVEGGRLLANRTVWLQKQKRMAHFKKPLWEPATNYGVPLLAALVLATPGWSWRRRGRALALGLGWLTLTQIALLLVTIVDTQQTVIRNTDGTLLQVAGFSPPTQRIFFVLYEFFDLMGRGFFALLIYLGLIAFGWNASTVPVPRSQAVEHNAPSPRGSGRKSRGRNHKSRTTRKKSTSAEPGNG